MAQGINPEQLEEQAMSHTGLSDFGDGDWRQAMLCLIGAAEEEARLNDTGRAMLRGQLLDRLVNRLEIQSWVTLHPEVREDTVEGPLILATLPRTGQTASGWIFDRDASNLALRSWFVKRPCPPPLAEGNENDPRLAKERAMVDAMPKELRKMHLYDADEPDECHYLISNDFKIPHEIYSMQIPGYYRWVRDEADMAAAYRYYLLQLKILQSNTPGRRWVLKNSPHLLFLNELHAVLPDAFFIQFHRDPVKVLYSNCRLSAYLRSMMSDTVNLHEVGASMLELIGDYVDRLLEFRNSGVSRPWIDVRFRDFVSAPDIVIEQIYGSAGIALDQETRDGMSDWVTEHPREDLKQASSADLEPYGISISEARERFHRYTDYFDVELDGI